MLTPMNVGDMLLNARIVAIFRGDYHGRWVDYAEALLAGGIRAMEVTLNSADALNGITRIRTRMPADILVGAGTVLSPNDVQNAAAAGAQFIVAPDTDESVISVCHAYNLPVIPGAYTATEIKRAYNLGGVAVKLFPAENPAYLKAIRAPLNHIPLMATGGVTLDNAAAFMTAGSTLVGIGSALMSENFNATEVHERAVQFVERVGSRQPQPNNR